MKIRQLAAAVLLPCLAASSFGQDAPRRHKWYVEADVGKSTLDHDQGFTEIDDTSSSWALRVGYRFSRYFALEGAYVDLGSFSSKFESTSVVIDQKASYDGFLLNSRVYWPVARHFELSASAGLHYNERDSSYDSNSGVAYQDNESNGGFSFGVGVAVPVNDRFEITLDYTQFLELAVPSFDFTGNPNLNDPADLYSITLGARFKF
jgi:opacity protein-like surface antigen